MADETKAAAAKPAAAPKAKPKLVKVRLSHVYKEGKQAYTHGDVVAVPEHVAAGWERDGGGTIVPDETELFQATPVDESAAD